VRNFLNNIYKFNIYKRKKDQFYKRLKLQIVIHTDLYLDNIYIR